MFGNRIEDEFANNISAAPTALHDRSSWTLLLAVALGIAAFLFWAATYQIEETARAVGRVIPSQQVQIVQSLEGGIVRALMVREGDIVEAGDVLMQIDDIRFTSERGELLEQSSAIAAETTRLRAEAEFEPKLTFPEELVARNPQATAVEQEVFLSRREQLVRELEILEARLIQKRSALEESRAQRDRTRAVLAPLSEEIELTGGMVDRGVVPKIELLRLQSRFAELSGDISVSLAAEPRAKAAIGEVQGQIKAARSGYVLAARLRLAKLQLELAVVQETLRAANDRVKRAELRAPVLGTINTIHMTTLGAVVQPGAALFDIVPIDDSLLIEADLGPRDIAFVRMGERASVKISAYDYLIYGAMEGEVVRIGADTIKHQDGTEFFRVVIQTDKSYLGTSENQLPITAGMIASVDIQTGQKTVLSYLAKPILRAKSEALRER
ncbi:HlyD family type I secretion periplasmic adaptor subunit [Sulfitobacter sp. SK012]|uniref:HlyD family type I secretion periplasmic adaptor subunit n=1 Tax=Sulfitobacter sp. SK012 TaxID=1389005 RepID=UPI000E0B4658|nr:HlyD family type I secretion periplasmic adaptor subunit [Sulfitobacter sp. SK012]AXI46327.1 HlyD family type I secretion periplasmic adaptor subunit [Sulfitobacter sp. SK012]